MDSPRPKDEGRAEAFRRQEAYPCLQEPVRDSHYAAETRKRLNNRSAVHSRRSWELSLRSLLRRRRFRLEQQFPL